MTHTSRRAVFLDRDGVIIPDNDFTTSPDEVRLFDGTAAALSRLDDAGFALIVITNQPVIARGLASAKNVDDVNKAIRDRIESSGGPGTLHFYVCPHHPNADVEAYRVDCDCRKPRPGLLRRAAAEHGLDLGGSFMIGDRISDIAAGAAAGCRTVQVLTGRHLDPPIETPVRIDSSLRADAVCNDLAAAADWILEQ